MTAAKAGILRTGELKSLRIGAPIGTRKGSTSMIKGITVFGFGAPIGLHKRNCDDSLMVADAKRSQTSGPSGLFQTMRRPHRFIKPLGNAIDARFDRGSTPDNPRLWRPMAYDA